MNDTTTDLQWIEIDMRAVVAADPHGVHSFKSEDVAAVLAELDRLREIKQRARRIRDGMHTEVRRETARYILGGEL